MAKMGVFVMLSIVLLIPLSTSGQIPMLPPLPSPTFEDIHHCPEPKSKYYLQHWSCGNWENVGGEMRRVFRLYVNENSQVETGAPNGELFKGWTFNGTIPGPTMRMTEGDKVTIYVFNPENSTRNHSLHMHSIHMSKFDGAGHHDIQKHFIKPDSMGQYFFTAQPAGVYPYHCHINPVPDHINRGLYGAMIIDPKEGREPANEMVMLMNGYDYNYEQEGQVSIEMPNRTMEEEGEEAEAEAEEERDNEIYTVNGKAFEYAEDAIEIKLHETQRIYLLNMVEFDPVNSFHLHGGMFKFIPSGTLFSEDNGSIVTDIVTLGQGDRGILEFSPPYDGTYMIHSHINEFTDLGWMGVFNVTKT